MGVGEENSPTSAPLPFPYIACKEKMYTNVASQVKGRAQSIAT